MLNRVPKLKVTIDLDYLMSIPLDRIGLRETNLTRVL